MDLLATVGQCDNGFACVYQNNLSWSSPTTPLPAEAHPRIVFERLFGEGGSSDERRAALQKRASLLDAVTEDAAPALFGQANQLRLAGDTRGAIVVYKLLTEHHPASEESKLAIEKSWGLLSPRREAYPAFEAWRDAARIGDPDPRK